MRKLQSKKETFDKVDGRNLDFICYIPAYESDNPTRVGITAFKLYSNADEYANKLFANKQGRESVIIWVMTLDVKTREYYYTVKEICETSNDYNKGETFDKFDKCYVQ